MLTIHASDLQQWIVQLLWPLTRIFGCLAMSPIFGHAAIPKRVKLAIGFVLTAAILPTIQTPEIAVFSWQGLFSLLAEFLKGVSMGFVVRLVFSAVEMAGFMIGMSMGLGFASFYDPQAHGQSLAINQMLGMLALLIFLSLDGHLIVVATLQNSFETMPIGVGQWHLNAKELAVLGKHVFAQGLLLALPVIASLLITNMALGILTKAAPQFNIFGIGFPITIGVGLLMTMLGLPAMVNPLTRWMIEAQQMMLRVFS